MTEFESALNKVLNAGFTVTIAYRMKLSGAYYRVTVTDSSDFGIASASCNSLAEVAEFLSTSSDIKYWTS
jgi:hypothetical protein